MGQKFKGQKRCAISNKLINGKEVVITDYAVDYVKKLGFIVIQKNKIESYQRNLITASLLIFFIFMLPLVSPKLLTEADAQIIFNNNTYNNNSFFNVSNFITNITNITNITQVNNTFFNITNDSFVGNYSSFLISYNLTTNNTFLQISNWNSTNLSYYLNSNPSEYINWSVASNGTLLLTSNWNSTNVSYATAFNLSQYLLISNWNATNTSYYLNSNPLNFINSSYGNLTYLKISNWNATNSSYALASQVMDRSSTEGRGSDSISSDSYYHVRGGSEETNDNDESQLTRLAYAGTLHNLTFIMSTPQGIGDICVLYVNYNSTFGTTANTLLFANLTGVNQIAINKTTSINVSEGSFIKMFMDEQGNSTCVGQPSWSFIYQKN